MNKCIVIAEAGVNHNGDIELAKQLVIEAKASGADCVKFQTFKAERVVSLDAPKADYQNKTTDPKESQFEMLKKLEMSDEYYSEYIYTWEANILDLDAYPELSETFNMPDTTLEKNTLRPNEEIKLFAIPSGPAYGFINYTYGYCC